MFFLVGIAVLGLTSVVGAAPDCQPPVEPEEREVTVALRAGGRATRDLDEEFDSLRKKSSIRPSLPHDLAQGGYSELMQEMMASWSDFMDYQPDRDDKFEEGDRKSRGKFTWKTRLQQLKTIVQHGLKKKEIMSMYAGQELRPAVAGSYWLNKLDHENLALPGPEAELFAAIWELVGPRRLFRPLRRCEAQKPCACHFLACSADGMEALELRSSKFDWSSLKSFPSTATAVKFLALDGPGALNHPEVWLRAFPKLKVLQLGVPASTKVSQVLFLLSGWQHELLGLSLHWHPTLDLKTEKPIDVPEDLLETICVLKQLRRLNLDGYITRLPDCFGQLPLLEMDVRGLQFRDEQALPAGLAALGRTLVSFVAYSQGLDRSCNHQASWNKTSPAFLTRCRPRPSWDAAEPIDATEDDAWAWQCPWESWLVKLDDPQAPWWSWQKIERFWVDANFFHGSFPPALVEAWPSLRSLDLQLNEISGPLPGDALGQLENLTALRLHRNRFSGPVPAAIFQAPRLHYANLEGNSELSGCIPGGQSDENHHHLALPIQGTKITGLCEAEHAEL